jgi:thiol:disulfide interchange protein
MKRSILTILSLALIVTLGQGCAPAQSRRDTPTEPTQVAPNDSTNTIAERRNDEMSANDPVANLSGSATYEPYTKEAYEEAKGSGKPILLFFYANWCPTCKVDEPILKKIIQETDADIIAFRVNTLDSDTDADEEELAEEFGIFIQHTFIFIDRNGNPLNQIIGTQGEKLLKSHIQSVQ